MNPAEEMLPLVDCNGNVIGKASRSSCHSGSMALHPVVHLHIISSDRSGILLQKRSETKKIQPGKWDTSVGGHVSYGESVEESLRREAMEEASLTGFDAKFIKQYVFESNVERELINCFACVAPDGYVPHVEMGEADSVRFWTWDEIAVNIGRDVFTPNFEGEFMDILNELKAL